MRTNQRSHPTLLQRGAKMLVVLASCLITAAFIGGLAWGLAQAHKQAMSPSQPNQEASEPTPTPTPSPTPGIGVAGLVRFSDTQQGTRFAVQTNASDPNAGVFNFTTPTGYQYHGGQASDLQHHDGGKLGVLYDGSAQLIGPAADGQDANVTTVTVHLNAALDLTQQQATVEITDATNSQSFSLTTAVPAGASQAVQAYDQALINQDWATVYNLTSQTTLGGATEAQFAQAMQQQVQTVGAVTATSITSQPQVTIDTSTGITTFLVTEQMTITLNGVSQTQSITSQYILENGIWKFLASD